jgi:hypothetical protein
MKRSYTSMLSASLVLAMAVALPAAAQREAGESPQDIKSQDGSVLYNSDDDPDNDCGDGNNVTIFGDPKMWPPNHKYQDYIITATDADGGTITLGTRASHDEYVIVVPSDAPQEDPSEPDDQDPADEEQGAGNTFDDAAPFYTFDSETETGDSGASWNEGAHQLRSERSARGDGRTYTLAFWAQFDDNMEGCTGRVTVEVPHDMRSSNAPSDAKDRTGDS